MNLLKNLLGIPTLKSKISQNQSQISHLQSQINSLKTQLKNQPNQIPHKTKTLQILKSPTSTIQLAKILNISRSQTSRILNQLEQLGKIEEHSKSGNAILYKKSKNNSSLQSPCNNSATSTSTPTTRTETTHQKKQ